MDIEIVRGSHWVYLGDDDGFELVHKVLHIDINKEPGVPWITTFSEPDQDRANDPGYSWNGPFDDFLQHFEPLEFLDEPNPRQ